MADSAAPSRSGDPLEDLVADAVLALEQGGEQRLQEFLARHSDAADAIRAGLERLRRMGVLAPPPAAMVEPRQFGEFRVLRQLAAGGMGVVYLAEQTSLRRQVALKVVRPELLLSPTARERFQREVETVARLQHPGIVPILAVGSEGAVPWYAMEYVAGRSLEAVITALHGRDLARSDGAALRALLGDATSGSAGVSSLFTGSYWEVCARIVLQLAQAMSYVHARGIVHRDLKPSNVVITPQGQALVLDFGLAHVEDRERVTRTDVPVGSPAYMAPEQVRGEAIDERVDVYGLGVTLYQLLTGELPFAAAGPDRLRQAILAGGARPVRARNRAVPRDLATVCAVAMDRDRGRRYAAMAAFAADLEAVLQRRPIRAVAPGPGLRLWRGCQRHPIAATVAAALLVIGLQFPIVLWRIEATARQDLASANTRLDAAGRELQARNADLAQVIEQLRVQRTAAERDFFDAQRALREMAQRVGQEDLAATPGSEPLRLSILQRATRLYEQLRARHPDGGVLAVDAARTALYAASMLDAMGRQDAAVERYHEVFATLGAVPGDDADVVRGVVHKRLGQLLTQQGDHVAAEQALRTAVCLFEDLVGRRAVDRSIRRQLVESVNSLAIVRRMQGAPQEELALLASVQPAKLQLHREDPGDLAGATSYALGCSSYGAALLAARRADEALAEFEAGISTLEALLPVGAEGVTLRQRLAMLYDRRGSWYQDRRDFARAESDHGCALALRAGLAADFPSTAQYVNQHGASLHNLAMVRRELGQDEEAVQLEVESIERQRQAVRMAPRQVAYAEHLEYALVGHCVSRMRLDDWPGLLVAVGELEAGAVTIEGKLNAARLCVRCAGWVAATDEAAALRWRQRAVTLLERAEAQGFRDATHFTSARWRSYYADLRAMPAFTALLARLQAK